MLVKNWMNPEVITVNADDSMQTAIYLLQEHGIKNLPVMEKDTMVGIITDRDLKKASPSDATTLDMHELLYLTSKIKVKSIMIKDVYTVRPDTTIEEAAAILLEKNISGLPVVDEQNRLVGIINQIDLFQVILSLTGRGKKGVQIAVQVKDMPGPIKEIRELVRKYKGRTASILTSGKNAPPGFLNLYFRIYQIDRDKLPSLIEEIKEKGTMLYVVDHKEDKRTLFNSK